MKSNKTNYQRLPQPAKYEEIQREIMSAFSVAAAAPACCVDAVVRRLRVCALVEQTAPDRLLVQVSPSTS